MATPLEIIQHPSPNFGPRRNNARPNLIVLHYTAMQSAQAALERLCAKEFEVSAHYLISKNGDIFQMVAEHARAWHAGAGRWGSCEDINSNSIGIELDNTGLTPYSAPQMAALEALLPEVMHRWNIPKTGVIAHSDIAPARKTDPGRRFDWRRLALSGLAVWPENSQQKCHVDPVDWCKWAAKFGYGIRESTQEAPYLAAFRDRFRAGYHGPLDHEDMRIIQNLAARFPVDEGRANA